MKHLLTTLILIAGTQAYAGETLIHEEENVRLNKPLDQALECHTYGQEPNIHSSISLSSKYAFGGSSKILALSATHLRKTVENDQGEACKLIEAIDQEAIHNFGFVNTTTTRKIILVSAEPGSNTGPTLKEVITVTIANLGNRNPITLSGEGSVFLGKAKEN